MKLVLHKITHADCPVELREKAAFTPEQHKAMLKQMHAHPDLAEAVILETCNRIEFYLYAKKNFDTAAYIETLVENVRPDSSNVWKQYNSVLHDGEAVGHLFEVVAGLDSQMLGENQILAQVKAAYRQSVDAMTSRFIFHRLFHLAFRVGKAVRAQTDINCGAVSISLAAVELAKSKLNPTESAALVIGAGENAELAARYLLKAGLKTLIIANRNRTHAQEMAARLHCGQVISLEQIPDSLAHVDIVIASTAAEQPIVRYSDCAGILKTRKTELLIIDIAVPRDIDSKIGEIDNVTLFNIDQLSRRISQNLEKRALEIPKARHIIADFTEQFAKWHDSLSMVPVISQLNRVCAELAKAEANRYSSHFGEENREKLEIFAASLVKKILHGPISFLKAEDDAEPGLEQLQAVDLVNKMFFSQGGPQQ